MRAFFHHPRETGKFPLFDETIDNAPVRTVNAEKYDFWAALPLRSVGRRLITTPACSQENGAKRQQEKSCRDAHHD
ncbi:MAG: hypothetical protein U5L08_10955 [Xanthomonadales bacterium]|nr:hypothetical protein [Xanthomonadales bacterium]